MVQKIWSWWVLAVLVSVGCQYTAVADDDLDVITILTEDERITDEDNDNMLDRPVRTCGVPFKSPDRHVVGGENADPHEFPWIVALLHRHDRQHICGGALVTDRHVLTAAHCFDRKNTTNIIVRLGEYNIDRNQRHVDYWISKLKVHPNYMSQTDHFRNDVAVVFINGYAPYNAVIRPICLPPRGLDYTEHRAVATGWGRTDNRGNWAHILQEVSLPIWHTESCNYAFEIEIYSSRELCAGERGRDTCLGDSGGPLILQIGGHWSIVGIVSWGPKQCGTGLPGVYTRVDAFVDWIIDTVRGN